MASQSFTRGNVFASRDMADARRGSLRLYRRALKAAPKMVRTYRLPHNVQEIRQKIRYDFESHSHVNDPALVDLLVMKGENKLEEVEQNWATKAHVVHYLDEVDKKREEDQGSLSQSERAKYLSSILEGTGTIDSWQKHAQ